MNKKLLLSLVALALVAVIAFWAIPQSAQSEAGLQCTLTGQTIEKCCCETRGDKTYCPLADKTVEECCCATVDGSAEKHS
jgi:hypothetical protein